MAVKRKQECQMEITHSPLIRPSSCLVSLRFMAHPTPRPRQRTSDIDLSEDIPLSAGISVADSEDSHHSQAGEVILGKRNRAASEESGRSAPPLRNLAGDVIPSPLNASNLEGPSQLVLDRVLARIISGDVYRLPQVLREMLKEEYYPGYALYALRTRDHARRSTCQILCPRKPAEELAWIIRLELPPSLAAAIVAIADLAAAYIWGCLPNRSLTVSGPHNPARDLVPVSDSAALSALADIRIALARAFWSDNTPYVIQSHRSELFALGSDLPPMKKDVASEDLCSICGTVMSYAVKPLIVALDIRARIRARLLPDVDTSRIKYSWETLQFPMAPRPHVLCACLAEPLCVCPRDSGSFCVCMAASMCWCELEDTLPATNPTLDSDPTMDSDPLDSDL
ncbi:hypothetical protein C8F01DRAFT_1095621 [Mycena amicta]|nr:hypothetical protein C8F01DRAFT_1095621 [Mycena amicta]